MQEMRESTGSKEGMIMAKKQLSWCRRRQKVRIEVALGGGFLMKSLMN